MKIYDACIHVCMCVSLYVCMYLSIFVTIYLSVIYLYLVPAELQPQAVSRPWRWQTVSRQWEGEGFEQGGTGHRVGVALQG